MEYSPIGLLIMIQRASFEWSLALNGDQASEDLVFNLTSEVSGVPSVRADPTCVGAIEPGLKSVSSSTLGIILGGLTSSLPILCSTIGEWLTRQPPGTTLRLKDGA